MTKKVKSFNIGDKVFAKVKGYPAWPAKIVSANGKKYEVTFYGTMETGSIKVEDLFYYLKHKDQFYRNLKRKDYLEAVEQIEAEIKETGTDGNNGDESETSTITEVVERKGKKRKRESVTDEMQAKKLNNRTASEEFDEFQEREQKFDESPTVKDEDVKSSSQSVTRSGRIVKVKKFSDDEDEDTNKRSTKIRKTISLSEQQCIQESNDNSISTTEKIDEDCPQDVNQDERDRNEVKEAISVKETNKEEYNVSEKEEIIDINIVFEDYLETVIAYGEHVKSKAPTYKKRPVEPRDVLENEVIIAKLPSNTLVGIKYNRNAPTCDNEYEKAVYESQEARRVLSLKEKLENGTVTPGSEKDQLVLNIQFNERDIQEKNEARILERKKAKLKYLKIEANLVEYDCKIKSCLGLDKADPKKAYEYMNLMMELNINTLMLKKHPLIVDVMKRLRRYIGNVKEWKLAGDSLETFETDAEKIRQKAEEVFMKFMLLFNVTDNSSFWDVFHAEVEKFKEETKNMSEGELFALCAEPCSRQAFFDSYEDEEDAEKVQDTKEIEQKEKENSSDVANTEQIVETQENAIETP